PSAPHTQGGTAKEANSAASAPPESAADEDAANSGVSKGTLSWVGRAHGAGAAGGRTVLRRLLVHPQPGQGQTARSGGARSRPTRPPAHERTGGRGAGTKRRPTAQPARTTDATSIAAGTAGPRRASSRR